MLASAIAIALSSPHLPTPSGPHPVGTISYEVADLSRKDLVKRSKPRELQFQIWYPAAKPAEGRPAPYLPSPRLLEELRKAGYYMQKDEDLRPLGQVKTHAHINAAPMKGRFPVVLLSEGQGVIRSNYTSFGEDLASCGYFVVGIDHPYNGVIVWGDGHMTSGDMDPRFKEKDWYDWLVAEWAGDASFLLDWLQKRAGDRIAKHADLSRVGMMGHSLGGAAGIEASRRDRRIRVVVNMDGAPFGESARLGALAPTLILLSNPDYTEAELKAKGRTPEKMEEAGRERQRMFAAVFDSGKGGHVVKIRGTAHMTFSDAPYVLPDLVTHFGGQLQPLGQAASTARQLVRAFLDTHLKRDRARFSPATTSDLTVQSFSPRP